MDGKTLKINVINSLLWKFAERIGTQLITFVLSIILARLLSPSDYGAIAIVLVFISIADVFIDAGFGSALIQKKDADNLDFSSVFYFNVLFSIFIYVIIYILSPYIVNFYDMPILQPILQVLALRIPFAAINSVQQAYVSRNMQFKKFFYSTLSGTVVSAIIGIIMAYNDCGIWSLVGQYLSSVVVNTFVLFKTINWRPQLIFSLHRLRSLFSYGWKILFSGLLDTGYNSLNGLLIGKFYTPADLAFFETGKKFPIVIVININSSINSVLFPALASAQDEPERIKAYTRKALQISSYIMLPMMLGIVACADNIVSLLLTDKWLSAVPYLQIFCITYGLWPIHTANIQAINAMGRSDIFLKIEILKKFIGIIALFIAINYGIIAVAMSYMIVGVISTFINAYPNKFLLKYTYFEQIQDIFPSIFLSIIMFVCVKVFAVSFSSPLIEILLKVIIGLVVYLVLSIITKNETCKYLVKIITENIKIK